MPDENNDRQTALVVEDDISLANAISKKLELNGFNPIVVRSADEALGFMNGQVPVRLIWLDHYLLGEKDGLSFTKDIKENALWKQIPIYVVSNTASHDKVDSYNRLGITRYYVKAEHRLDEIINDIKTKV